MTEARPFDAGLYKGQVGPSRRSASAVLPLVVDLLEPRSMLDVGCGAGAWLAAARDLGVDDVVGIEGGHPDEADLQVPADLIVPLDLRGSMDLGRRFDVTLSVEVAEHIPAEDRGTFVETLTRHSDAIVFSAAVPGQGGAHHVNEQWPTYWADDLAARGFDCFDPWRARLWEDERVEWWYRQNLLLFARAEQAERVRAAGHEPGPPLRLVHPSLHDQTVRAATRTRGVRESGSNLLDAVRRRRTS